MLKQVANIHRFIIWSVSLVQQFEFVRGRFVTLLILPVCLVFLDNLECSEFEQRMLVVYDQQSVALSILTR